jgi:hypothetical protein
VLCAGVALFLSGGCGGDPDCLKETDSERRDWCYYEVATAQAGRGEIPAVKDTITKIQGPMARAAAINKVFSLSPTGLSHEDAMAMCGTLSGQERDVCMNTWSRPHLWTP